MKFEDQNKKGKKIIFDTADDLFTNGISDK